MVSDPGEPTVFVFHGELVEARELLLIDQLTLAYFSGGLAGQVI